MGNTNLKASDLDPDNFQGKSTMCIQKLSRASAMGTHHAGVLETETSSVDRLFVLSNLRIERGRSKENCADF